MRKYSVWFDDELKNLRKRRRAAERKWKKSSVPEDKELYIKLKKCMNCLIKLKRTTYHKKHFIDAKGNTKKIYRKLNSLLGKGGDVFPDHNCEKNLLRTSRYSSLKKYKVFMMTLKQKIRKTFPIIKKLIN